MAFLSRSLAVPLLLATAFPATAQDNGWEPILSKVPESYSAPLRGIDLIETPEMYELAAIIVSLTPAGSEFMVQNTPYAKEVRDHFGRFAQHPAVASLAIRSRSTDFFTAYSLRENAYIYCFDGETVRIIRCRPFSHVWGRQSSNAFVANMAAIRDFANVTGFRDFYSRHTAFYESEAEAWRLRAPMKGMNDWLEARFPARASHNAIVFSSLVSGWHSTQSFSDDQFVANIMFLQSVSSIPVDKGDRAARMVFTEIDHNYVNPISDNFKSSLDSNRQFGNKIWISDAVSSQYSSGYSVFNEYMTWGVFLLWADDVYSAEQARRVDTETSEQMTGWRGFPQFPAFMVELRRLYANQGGQKNIAALYPEILEWSTRHTAEQLKKTEPYTTLR